jgi:hypothetical protein
MTLSNLMIFRARFLEGACRGFAYLNLETSDMQLTRCMNILNGCAWKGGKLHISFAKANKFRTLEDGRIVFIKNEEDGTRIKKKKIPKKKRKLVRHSCDFSLVTDKNVDKRKGWRRGRYGRAIACLRIRRPNRQMLIIDPSHYKNNLEKLFGSVKPKPLSHLTWTITEIGNELEKCADEEEIHEYVFEDAEDNNMEVDEIINNYTVEESNSEANSDVEVVIEAEPEPNFVNPAIQETVESIIPETIIEHSVEMDTEVAVEDPIIVNTVEAQISEEPKYQEQDPTPAVAAIIKSEPKFEVNVNWSSLFAPATGESTSLFGSKVSNESNSINGAGGFSLNSLIEKSSKIKNVSMDELFKKPEIPVTTPAVKHEESKISVTEPVVKKVHNYAHLFGDLNRITPTTAVRFGMHLSGKEELMQEWRIERLELKEDFKKRLAEGKRRNRRGNHNGNKSNV